MCKRILTVFVVSCFLFTFCVPAFAVASDTGFSDVSLDAWYAEAVAYCRDHGLMSGTSSTTFSPNQVTTRTMLVTILYRQTGAPEVTNNISFSDTEENAWYSNAISWAVNNGIVSGYGNGNFGINDPVTREQAATILWRYAGSPDVREAPADFADESRLPAFAVKAVDWAQENGVVSGKANNLFDPKGEVTRAEIAAILYRYLSLETESADDSDSTTAPDNEAENPMIDLIMTVGNRTFAAKLYDNESTRALTRQLPMTVNMGELNGNEKYYFLSNTLPTNSERPGQIKTGDFMLYGNDCLVLFYKDFFSSYSYTRLGYIEDVTGLANALGSGSVEVTFSVK